MRNDNEKPESKARTPSLLAVLLPPCGMLSKAVESWASGEGDYWDVGTKRVVSEASEFGYTRGGGSSARWVYSACA